MFRSSAKRLISHLANTVYSTSNNKSISLYTIFLIEKHVFLFEGLNIQNKRNFQRLYSKSVSGSVHQICVGDLLRKWKKIFKESAILEPQESIQFILCHHLNIERISDIYKKEWLEHNLTQDEIVKINSMCGKRLQSCPIQYIVEEWAFRDLTLKMKPPVFIPRPETEELVEIVKNDILLKHVDNVLEICCGSGAICLSLLKEFLNISVLALDKSADACSLTAENAKKNNISDRLTVLQHDITLHEENMELFAGKQNYFDIIVSNPPYVPTKDMKGLQPEILLYEDLSALDGGSDGMDIIKPILRLSSVILRPGGKLYLELDPSHPDIIRTLLQSNPEESTHATTVAPTKPCREGQCGIYNQEMQDRLREFGNLGLRIRNVYKDFNQNKRFIEIVKFE